MSDNNRWNLNRVGQAAVVTAPAPNAVPSYGLAYDLGTRAPMSTQQYQSMMRTFAQRASRQQVENIEASPEYQTELQRAQNLQRYGLSVTDTDLSGLKQDDLGKFYRNASLEDAGELVSSGLSAFGNLLGQGADFILAGPGAASQMDDPEGAAYDAYKSNGGILSRDDFEEFDEDTRAKLVNQARGTANTGAALGLPGIKQAAEGLTAAYRGLQVPFIMAGENGHKNPLATILDPMWFDGSDYAKAWRQSQDQSLGNSIVNAFLEPYVGHERIDRWRRDSALYDLSSMGVELGAGWYADAGVIGGKAVGGLARVKRGELPLNENSRLYRATTQALQREKITVGGVTGQLGKWRAGRISNRWEDVAEVANKSSLSDFLALPMFNRRDIAGAPAGHALYYALRENPNKVSLKDAISEGNALNYGDLPTLTRQLLHGDPKAYEDLGKLNEAVPAELQKYDRNAGRFLDALNATRTRLDSLQREADQLEKAGDGTPFHDWVVHADLADKKAEIAEVERKLDRYEGYRGWMESLNQAPKIERVSPKQSVFMDNQYGPLKHVLKYTKPMWLKKANVASMHDIDSGVMSLRRQSQQMGHLFGYDATEALDDAVTRWTGAETAYDRYEVMRRFEQTHLINAAAQKFGVDSETIEKVYDHIRAKQNEVYGKMQAAMRGQESLYSTAPELKARVQDAGDEGVEFVSLNPDTEMVTLRLKSNSGAYHEVEVHESALTPHGSPVDPTQTPNYYQPFDTRRFYIELKHNSDIIEMLDHPNVRTVGAAASDLMDKVGTRFNALWKPAVLFRFGWPMRVLMDEHMRAMAVLGIPNYFRYHGKAEAVAVNNVFARTTEAATNRFNALVMDPLAGRKAGRDRFNIGPGPVADLQRRKSDPLVHDQTLVESPRVFESFLPQLDNDRYARVAGHVGEWDEWERLSAKAAAWERHKRDIGPLNETQQKAYDAGMETLERFREGADAPLTPIRRIVMGRGEDRTLAAYDPLSARQESTGFAVPLPQTKARLSSDSDFAKWYSENREYLGSTGHRVYFDADGNVYVARVFKSNVAQRQRAAAMTQQLDSEMVNLKTGVTARFETAPGAAERDLAYVINDEIDKAQAANAELRGQEADAVENYDFDVDLDFQHEKILRRRQAGAGMRTMKSSDGRKFEYPDAFEGHHGELMRDMMSSKGTMEALSDGHGAATSLFRRNAVGHKAYQPPRMDDRARTKGTRENREALEYFHQWGNLLNAQIAHSPIWSKMLAGWDDDRIVHWLDHTAEGGRVRREVKADHGPTELWVNEHRAKLDYYLPSRKLQRLLGKGRLDMSQLRREVAEEDYPTVFGPDVEILDRRSATGQMVGWAADRVWHALGTLPIDTLSRHPFSRAMYDLKMKSLIGSTDAQWLDGKTLERYERQSRNFAREQVRRTLWDLTDQTNFADALRFVAPFWAAQSEAITKWARIVSDRPETIARFFNLQRAVYNNYAAVDEEGKPIKRKSYFDYSPTDRIVIRIPEPLRHGPWGKALETVGSLGIPLGSANTILQGENPILPGPGPLVTVPADKFLRTFKDNGVRWDENDLYRWLFPIGRPQHGGIQGILDQVAPGWSKRVMQLNEGDDGIAFSNLQANVGREMILEAERKGLPRPTYAEIQKQAKWLQLLRTVTGLVSPVQTQFRPKHQFWIDEAHRYQRTYGLDWFDRFVEKYGLAASRYTISSTNSTVGVPPTKQGMEEWSQNSDLIQKYQNWGGAIISPEAYTDDFSSDAYYAQTQTNLGPGDSTKLREGKSVTERFDEADARAGWYEFRQVDAILDAQLADRGLTSLNQTAAEDLAQIKSNFIADLTQRNPAWREQFDNFNNDIYTRVNELEQWAYLPQFDNRPDIQGVRQYLMIRDQVAHQLDAYYAATGGSRSLQAQENSALRDWFYAQVGGLAQANPSFAEFYSRYLSQDTLTQGSGGF